jgi:hypothetical protein
MFASIHPCPCLITADYGTVAHGVFNHPINGQCLLGKPADDIVISRGWPLWTGWPPLFFPELSGRLWVLEGRFSSLDGGTELFLLFFGVSYFETGFQGL